MTKGSVLAPILSILMLAVPFRSTAAADVCVTIDEVHDTFSASERTAAVMLVEKQFELAGTRVVRPPCPDQYALSHIRLGQIIAITLAGPTGRREASANGLGDVPSVYNQMVRSLLTGQPMDLTGVVDRTNVTSSQATKLRVDSDSVFYARLGYGAVFADQTRGVPSIGLIGYRHELDSFAVDVSFLNFQISQASDYGSYYGGSQSSSGSWLKLEALRFTRPVANQSPYFGGGLSWGGTSTSSGNRYWSGSGLQGELTVGYEMARASSIRVFVQADAGLPFYHLTSRTYSYTYPYTRVDSSQTYAPTLTLSMGLGWQRRHR